MTRRVGIFGGSFNPVHHGHLLAARAALERLRLDTLLFIPCGRSADGKRLLPAPLRLQMLKAALRHAPQFKVSDLELRRPGVSRTFDTLLALKRTETHPTHYFLLIGADQAAGFSSWKNPLELSKMATLCVLDRPGAAAASGLRKKYGMRTLSIPPCAIASSVIRARLAAGSSVRWMLPDAVLGLLVRRFSKRRNFVTVGPLHTKRT